MGYIFGFIYFYNNILTFFLCFNILLLQLCCMASCMGYIFGFIYFYINYSRSSTNGILDFVYQLQGSSLRPAAVSQTLILL